MEIPTTLREGVPKEVVDVVDPWNVTIVVPPMESDLSVGSLYVLTLFDLL